mgnify:CR=1 FL=1
MPIAKKETFEQRDPLWAIILSIVIASVLMVYPVSYDLSAWRPVFMLLVMLFWVMCQPAWCGVWFAFSLGLFTDLLMELPLGVSAFSYISIAFTARYLTRNKRIMTFANLWTIVTIAVLWHLLLLWLLLVMVGEDIHIIRHWKPIAMSILIWPFVYQGLKKWRAA